MLEFGEANTLYTSYRTHLREKGKDYADAWVKKALAKSHKGYNAERVRTYMRQMERERMEHADYTTALRAAASSPQADQTQGQ